MVEMTAGCRIAEIQANHREWKINAILSEKSNRQPMCITVPPRAGKRFRGMIANGQRFSELIFTAKSDLL